MPFYVAILYNNVTIGCEILYDSNFSCILWMQVDCFLNVVNDILLNWLKFKRICKRQRTLYSQRGGPISPY